MRFSLKRIMTSGAERYYKIHLLQTLFGDYLVIREYGNSAFHSPTRILTVSFSNIDDAVKCVERIFKQKTHKGYRDVSLRKKSA